MRTKIRGSVTLKAYAIVCEAVERGVAYGITRAHKHTDRPTEEQLTEHIEREVMNELSSVLAWDDEATV